MSTNSPHGSTPSSSHRVTLFFAVMAALGVPGGATLSLFSHNPWQAVLYTVLYEIALLVLAFVRRVWQHLEDIWSQETANWVNALVTQRWFSYSRYYARFLTFKHRDLDLKGLGIQNIYALEVEQVFVDVRLNPKAIHMLSSNPIPETVPQTLRAGQHSLWNYLGAPTLRQQHLVIVGAPGSGKTTLLKHLAITLVDQRHRRQLDHTIRRAVRLPFLLLLREHVQRIQQQPDVSLEMVIQDVLARWERPVPGGWVRQQLSKGRCLILLDGLDEVGESKDRKAMAQWVERQIERYAANRFLLSSRPFGYQNNPVRGVMVLEVQPFVREQVERFIQNWYRANEVMSSQKDDPGVRMRAQEGAADLIRRLDRRPALAELAVNPLLLTMIATIHRYHSTLPGKRVELYAEICEVFLGKRQQARDIQIELRPAQTAGVLQSLAYAMMLEHVREINPADAQHIIKDALRLVHATMTPQAFLQMVEQMSGLVVEREAGKLGFAHLTFQEYLAATFIHEQRLEEKLLAHLEESWWEESTRLYCAQTDATMVIEACLGQATHSVPQVLLALECLEEAFQVQPTAKLHLDQFLVQGAEDPDPTRRKIIAEALLARRLKELAPLREGVSRDTSLILCAEYQLFLDERGSGGDFYQPDHWVRRQFPAGHALLPALGVRPSDAQAFCNWLTRWDQGLWLYRLPHAGEVDPTTVSLWPAWLPLCEWDNSTAYWETWGTQPAGFKWMRPPSGTPAGIEEENMLPQVVPLDLDLHSAYDKANAIRQAKTAGMPNLRSYLVHVRSLALALAHDLESEVARDHAHALTRALDLTLTRVSTHASALDLALDLTHAFDCARALTRAVEGIGEGASTGNLTFALARDRDRVLDLARALSLALDRDRVLDRDLAGVCARFLDLARVGSPETPSLLDAAQLIALVSVCVSISLQEIMRLAPESAARSFWKRLFWLQQHEEHEVQKVWEKLLLMQGFGMEIAEKLEQLKKRRQGQNAACEGICIVREARR